MANKILIVKHGSFGDIILSTGAIKSVANYFPNHEIYLLTSSKYTNFMKQCPYIKKIIIDDRKSFYNVLNNFFLLKSILNNNFDYIIDFQNSKRTFLYNLLFRLLTNSMISSSRALAHFRYLIPSQGKEHVTQGLNNQLSLIGIENFEQPNVNWIKSEKKIENLGINSPYVMIIPGTSEKGINKRWSSKKYAEIAKYLITKKISIIVVGNYEDYISASPIFESCPEAINLLGKSPPSVLYDLAKKSNFIISNDTGPAFLVALSNKPLIWIVNDNVVSLSNYPIGKRIIKISSKTINDVSVDLIINKIISEKLI